MPAHDESIRIVRPLLGIPKRRLLTTLKVAGLPFADDPTNRDPRFARPRLRELMPRLAAEGLDTPRLAALARRATRADQAIEQVVDYAEAHLAQQTSPDRIVVGAGLAQLPAEVALRVLGRTIARVGHEGPVELRKLEALFEALLGAMGQHRSARFRRTLAGAVVTWSGEITIEAAPPRRSGRRKP
jgi:tRNA(Ile)-lysidine synthase